jgi:predicted CXXCH cytochrome family protein
MHLKVFGCEGFSFFRRKSMGWRHRIDHALSCRGRFASLAVGLTVALAGVATSLPAHAQLTSPKATGISTTKHNLGSGSSFGNKSSGVGATTEVCVFCHTPHAANVAAGPLWNRVAGTATYTPYTSASLTGGTRDAATGMGIAEAPGSISLACLSCHDGTQALNSVINAPGSGGYNAAGATFGGFTNGTSVAGKVAGVAAVGGDGLSNDHPIGVRYAGGALPADQVNGGYNQFATTVINNTDAFWVEAASTTVTGSGRQKADMWLYPRAGATAANNEAFVECASCHDPHTANPTFLRTPNDYSSVCLSCHIK